MNPFFLSPRCFALIFMIATSGAELCAQDITTAKIISGNKTESVDIVHQVPLPKPPPPPPQVFDIRQLPTPSGYQWPWVAAINEVGQVVGGATTTSSDYSDRVVLWTNGEPTLFADSNGNPRGTYAYALNNLGVVAGYGYVPQPWGETHSMMWTSPTGIFDISPPDPNIYDQSFAVGISDDGTILARCDKYKSSVWYAWAASNSTFLPLLPGYSWCNPWAMSHDGAAAGMLYDPNSGYHPGVYKAGRVTALADGGTTYAINNAGQVVGHGAKGAVAWNSKGAISTLSVTDGLADEGTSINDDGLAVGNGRDLIGNSMPIYWPDMTADGFDLNTVLTTDQAKHWYLHGAEAINNWGQIAGEGALDNSTNDVAFLLTPVAQIAVDVNRDGNIQFASEQDSGDVTSSTTPFRFWINNDYDRPNLTPDGPLVQDDGDPIAYASDLDWTHDQIPCERDLEDFARMWINVPDVQGMARGKIFIGLKWQNVTSTSHPAIKIYPAVEANGGTQYLTNPTTATTQLTLAAIQNAAPTGGSSATVIQPTINDYDFVIPATALQSLTGPQPTLHLLFEGCQRGTGELKTVMLSQDVSGKFIKIADGPSVFFDFKDIKEMYERWTVGDGPDGTGGGAPAANAAISQDRLPAGVGAFQYGAQLTADDHTYVLYVHGWNMHPWEKNAFAETMYKRLYWQGYRGRFGAFQWPTTYHDSNYAAIIDYDKGEFSAWRSAAPLQALLTKLSGSYTVDVLAHSMGNVVTGEALRLANQSNGLVNTYVATQAAIPGNCYDPALAGDSLLSFGGLRPNLRTPDVYSYPWIGATVASNSRTNFFNTNDYALSSLIWQYDQQLKPDQISGETSGTYPNQIRPPYGYSGSITGAAVHNGFYKTKFGADPDLGQIAIGTFSLNLEDRDNTGAITSLNDRYEIMAYAAQPRSKALGAISSQVGGFSGNNLQSLWLADKISTLHDYSTHPWHSAEFRFSNADQNTYWSLVMRQFRLLPVVP